MVKQYISKIKTVKKLLFIVGMLALFSCGYKKAEGDKHPSIPLFPKHTNNALKIIELPIEADGVSVKKLNANFYFSNYNQCYITNQDFLPVCTLQNSATSSYYVNAEGVVYSFTFDNKNSLDTLNVYESYKIDKATKKTPPLFKDYNVAVQFITVKSWDARNEVVAYVNKHKNTLKCLKSVNDYTCLLIFSENEIVLQSNLPIPDEVFNYKNCDNIDFNFEHESPTSFDKTILGNSSSGNHYVFGIHQFGYNYIELSLRGQSTKTKVKNFEGSDGLKIIYQNNTKDTLILKLEEDKNLYYLTKSKAN